MNVDRSPKPSSNAIAATGFEVVRNAVAARRRRRAIRYWCGVTPVKARNDPFATAKPDARLIKLLIRARRFNATLVGSDGVPFAALAKRQGVSPSYFTRLVRLSYLAPDITRAILEGRHPRGVQSRLPLAWHDQRTVLGFA